MGVASILSGGHSLRAGAGNSLDGGDFQRVVAPQAEQGQEAGQRADAPVLGPCFLAQYGGAERLSPTR